MPSDTDGPVLLEPREWWKAVKAGVTGHRNLGDDTTVDWVRARLEDAIDKLCITTGLTSLAVGTDQLFANVLRSRDVPFTAIIPSNHYESTFAPDEISQFETLCAAAADLVVLPFSEPSEDAYLEAGKAIVDTADSMIAVWNGKPARGRGGTADIVDYALGRAKRVHHINPELRSVTELP